MFGPTAQMPMRIAARSAFVMTSIVRRSTRSTYTPARAENRTDGTRNVRNSALTAELRLLASRTTTVSAYRTMLTPICVVTWDSQSSRNGRFRRTAAVELALGALTGAATASRFAWPASRERARRLDAARLTAALPGFARAADRSRAVTPPGPAARPRP